MIKISYIVPIYNAEKHLRACIESILAQKNEDIELILVNDGSTDSSPEICDEYGEQDSRVIVIHQTNSGVSVARNRGLSAASGEYIRFVDSDDKICTDCEAALVENCRADWITAGAVILDGTDRVLRRIESAVLGELKTDEILLRMDSSLKQITLHYVWNHFYKRERIVQWNLMFDESLSLGEDFLFNISYFKRCTQVKYISDCIYCYYKREISSLSGVFKKDELERRRRMDGEFLSLYDSKELFEKKKNDISIMIGAIAYASLLKIQHPLPKRAYKEKICFLKEMLNSEYYDYILSCLAFWNRKGMTKRLATMLIKRRCVKAFYMLCKIKYWFT